MPELPEVERYRTLAMQALHRPVADVWVEDGWYLKRATSAEAVRESLIGTELADARRIGKLLLLDIARGGTLGLHFGMSGTLLVDIDLDVESVGYSKHRTLAAWDRLVVRFEDGGNLRLNDARRLGGVELDPDESRLGVDALDLTLPTLRKQLSESKAPLKARIMDQAHIAGVGNLLADEALWRAGLDPARPANSLTEKELRRLQRHLHSTVVDLMERGGSGTGDLMAARFVGGACPKDGTALQRRQVGGRTTFSCPAHQS